MNKMYIFHILILYFLMTTPLVPSNKGEKTIDSLMSRLSNIKDDTNKVNLLCSLSANFYTISPDSGIKYADLANNLSGKIGWEKGKAKAYNNLGVNNSIKSNNNEAVTYFKKALNIYKELGQKEGISQQLGNLGIASMNLSNFTAALDYYQQALKIAEKDGIKASIARQNGNIGIVYTYLKDYNKALKYYRKSLEFTEKQIEKDKISKLFGNIAWNYTFLKDYDKALDYYQRALELDEELGNVKSIAIRLGNIGILYWEMLDYAKAYDYYHRALKMNEEIASKGGVAVNLGNLAALHFILSQDSVIQNLKSKNTNFNLDRNYNLIKAIEYAHMSKDLSLEIGDKRQLMEVYSTLDKANESIGNYENAYKYQTRWANIKDSIFSVEKTTEIANLEAKKENEIKEKELTLKDLELLRKVNEQTALFVGLAAVVILLIVIFMQRRKSEKLLLNIMPEKIAKRLKRNEKNIADRFEEVSIIFVDIVGFTSYSRGTEPEEIVSALNDIFTRFDILSIKHGLEKIKTIGDCYMAVAGLPEPHDNHTLATARFALEAKDLMHNYVTPDGHKLLFRIGIDEGPVVAGVIGESKFSYDLWGDAVNMASRMESTGLPNEIQVTENFINEVKDFGIKYTERGEVEIKGKGKVTTYLLK
ncbi:MAG: adenylate/guanylate cyclase domain-containing protein [Candidatus Kapaibacterium sp.]